MSRGHLFREMKRHDVRLSALADAWLAYVARMVRHLEGAGWEEIAFRSGYRGRSGLSERLFRVFRKRFREMDRSDPAWALERVRARMAEAVGGFERGIRREE